MDVEKEIAELRNQIQNNSIADLNHYNKLKGVLWKFFVYLNKVIGWDTPPDDIKIAELLEELGGVQNG